MTSAPLQNYLELAIQAAQLAGTQLLKYRGQLTHIRSKSSSGDLVTEADEASESAILEFLKPLLPSHGFLAEESGQHDVAREWLWAIDPLDGTLNYAHQLPFFCVSLGLLYRLQPVVGVIHAPVLQETFSAFAGGGAFLNGQPIQVSHTLTLRQSLLATGFPYRKAEIRDNNYAEFCYLADQTQDIRRPGSAALDLAYVACGRFDGFWERHLHAWDICAGALLVCEAGGQVSDYQGNPCNPMQGEIVASNGHIHSALQGALQSIARAGLHLKVTL